MGATSARMYAGSRLGSKRIGPKRCASLLSLRRHAHACRPEGMPTQLHVSTREGTLATPAAHRLTRARASVPGMLSADCTCAACVGVVSPRGRKPRADADKAIDRAVRSRLRQSGAPQTLGRGDGSLATPRLPPLAGAAGTPRSGKAHASVGRTTPRSSRAELALELPEDGAEAEGGAEAAAAPRPPNSGGKQAAGKDLNSKLQDLYDGAHAQYSPRTMAIYSDRQRALRTDPSGVAADEAKLVAQMARGRKRHTVMGASADPDLAGGRSARGGGGGGESARGAGALAARVSMAEGYFSCGNYTLADELLTDAIADCLSAGSPLAFELLKKRATAREKKGSGQPAADSGEEFGILADGWMEVGDHARAVAFYEHAASSRGAYGLFSSLLFSSLRLSCLVLSCLVFSDFRCSCPEPVLAEHLS
jgi:hypothetical protein